MSKPTKLKLGDDEIESFIKQNPLYKYRKRNTMSLRVCAIKCGGVSQTTVSKWEDGTMFPTTVNMEAIASLLCVTLDKLESAWHSWYKRLHPQGKERRHDRVAA